MPSASGTRLHGWWIPGVIDGGGTVVLMHGVRGNRLQMADRARVLNEHGFSVLLFDFQASGETPGHRITFGKLEGLDAAASEPKQFWAVKGAGHVDLQQYDPVRYWDIVLPLLNRYLKHGNPTHNSNAP